MSKMSTLFKYFYHIDQALSFWDSFNLWFKSDFILSSNNMQEFSTMLKKRSRPVQEFAPDSSISSDNVVHKVKGSSIFNIPSLFLGLTAKTIDSDSARSPTSPLDFKILNSFVRSPRSPPPSDGQPKSWDCNRVGLGLIDSLNDESKKTILLGSQLRISKAHLNNLKDDHVLVTSPKSLPENYAISSKTQVATPKFTIGSIENESKSNSEVSSLDSKNAQIGSPPLAPIFPGSGSLPIPTSGIKLSEEYTCIISHGPNPRTTHIFGDFILDSDTIQSLDHKNNGKVDTALASDDLLGYCFSCNKKLEHGVDGFIYRGEKAFCSCDCCNHEILSDEEMEKPTIDAYDEEIFISEMALAS